MPQLAQSTVADVSAEFDLAGAMKQALLEPEYYPPIGETVFPGDNVAIALQSNLPDAKAVLKSLLDQLTEINVAFSDIVVVISPVMADQFGIESRLFENLDDNSAEGKRPPILPVEFDFTTINFQVHDSENQSGLSYLAANAEGDPVHLNRILVDADVVLPVGTPNPGEANQQTDSVYPNFGSAAVKVRFASHEGSFVSRWQEIELANDSLGAFYSIQVVSGPGDSVCKIISGARKDATLLARQATNSPLEIRLELDC